MPAPCKPPAASYFPPLTTKKAPSPTATTISFMFIFAPVPSSPSAAISAAQVVGAGPTKVQEVPRVVLRFAAEKDLLLSGMITGGNEIAEKPAVVDVPHGKGHVVLFANNPMWRGETMGSYFLVFNALLNFDHLDAGGAATKSQ